MWINRRCGVVIVMIDKHNYARTTAARAAAVCINTGAWAGEPARTHVSGAGDIMTIFSIKYLLSLSPPVLSISLSPYAIFLHAVRISRRRSASPSASAALHMRSAGFAALFHRLFLPRILSYALARRRHGRENRRDGVAFRYRVYGAAFIRIKRLRRANCSAASVYSIKR